MDIFQNCVLAVLLIACICMGVKLCSQSVAISGLREFFEEYSNENADKHDELARLAESAADAAKHSCDEVSNLSANLADTNIKVSNIEGDVGNLKKGIVPDFEEARAAAAATNDFFQGVSNIMAFDPYKALHKDEDGEKT